MEKAPAVPVRRPFFFLSLALLKHQKKLIERGAHLTVPLIGQRDCA
ncbi:MAG: hypothetical protein ACRC9E_01520 [Plesiomonas shigelloides]